MCNTENNETKSHETYVHFLVRIKIDLTSMYNTIADRSFTKYIFENERKQNNPAER